MLHLLPHWNYVNEKVEITKMCGHGLGIHILKDKILILTYRSGLDLKEIKMNFEPEKCNVWIQT